MIKLIRHLIVRWQLRHFTKFVKENPEPFLMATKSFIGSTKIEHKWIDM